MKSSKKKNLKQSSSNEMAQQVRELAPDISDVSSILPTHTLEGENPLQKWSSDLHSAQCHM